MRILVLADIHSNWHALAAIDEPFDECLIVGDLVDYGTDPVPCVEWARDNASVVIRGNHDHAVAQRVEARNGSGFRSLAAAARPHHWNTLSIEHLSWLARLPVTQHVTLGDHRFFLVHATPHDPMDEYIADDTAAWTERLATIDTDFVLVGHTHIPMHLQLDRLQVVNPGSVGQPRDGDPRCSYAIIDNGKVELKRINYDIDATVRQMQTTGIDPQLLAISENVLRSGGRFQENGRSPAAQTANGLE